MALIICPECKSSISDAAKFCPHCGYPMELNTTHDTMRDTMREEESRLKAQIKKLEFQCPPPRVKVCMKCGSPFFYTNNMSHPKFCTPQCSCGFPGVEVDYPQQGLRGLLGGMLYILRHEVIPRNIGDKNSKEYQEYVTSLYTQIQKRERTRKENGFPDWKIEPIPPKPDDFGVYPKGELLLYPFSDLPPAAPKTTLQQPDTSVPRCPICGSTDLSKISNVRKAAKIGLFGIFGMGEVGKTWKCNKCGSRF